MKAYGKTLLAMATTSLLVTGTAMASTSYTGGTPITGPIDLGMVPSEVHNGSIPVWGENERTMALQAKIDAGAAVKLANRAHPGKVVEARLDSQNGSLIWKVTQEDKSGMEVQLMLDAGNGNLLAAEYGDHDEGVYEDREDADFDHPGTFDSGWHRDKG